MIDEAAHATQRASVRSIDAGCAIEMAVDEPSTPTALLSLWGKARQSDPGRPPCHPLVYHGLDVAAVGERLLELHAGTTARLAARCGWEPNSLRRAVVFLLALHDIGKIARPFQAKRPDLWPAVLGPIDPRVADPGASYTANTFCTSSPK